ncbi:Uncharacterised protein [Klebsiella pneumoniae]|nr:Uncharacterised protein [Klebsiella pneumoniae]
MCIARRRYACAGLRCLTCGGPVGRIRHLCRHPAQPRVRCLMCIARRRCACAGLRCLNLWRTHRPDKAFMPPSGTTAGTVSDVYRPAALRLHGPALFEPAKGLVGRIRHLCRHPAQPRVRRLMCIARRRCACAGLRCLNLWRTRRPDKAKPSGKRREERHYSAAVFPLPGSLNASPYGFAMPIRY